MNYGDFIVLRRQEESYLVSCYLYHSIQSVFDPSKDYDGRLDAGYEDSQEERRSSYRDDYDEDFYTALAETDCSKIYPPRNGGGDDFEK